MTFRVVFESAGPPLEVQAPAGKALVDVCDDSHAPVPFSCRSAACATCRIDVLEGADRLEPARDEELEILDLFGDDPSRKRLACQARLGTAGGLVRVRASQD